MQPHEETLRKGKRSTRDSIRLSGPEDVAIRICLAMFGGDWNRFATWLRGHPEQDKQRIEDLPLVERLAERDKREDILHAWLGNAIIENLRKLDVSQLNQVYEFTGLLIKASTKTNRRKRPSGARSST